MAQAEAPASCRPALPMGVRMAIIRRGMSKETVTFKRLDREHRREVARDAERLRTAQITPAALQAENSILPPNTRVRVRNLIGYAKRAYLNK